MLSQLLALSTTAALPACTTSPEVEPPSPTVVTIQTSATPALVAFRDEASATWQPLEATEIGLFEAAVDGPYRVVVVCASPQTGRPSSITAYARTPEDGDSIVHSCYAAPPHHVSGRMLHPGGITIGDTSMWSSEPGWDFRLPTHAGSFDLVLLAQYHPDHSFLAIRRDVEIAGDMDLGEITIYRDNPKDLVPTWPSTSNLRLGELPSSTTIVDTGTTVATIDERSEWAPRLAPDSVLRPTDRQIVSLAAEHAAPWDASQTRRREVSHDVRLGAKAEFLLPDPVGQVAFNASGDRLGVWWSELPEHDEVRISHIGFGSQSVRFHELALSRAFLDATGENSDTLDFRDVPGFQSDWIIDPTTEQYAVLAASRGTWQEGATSSVSVQIGEPAEPGPELRAARPRFDPRMMRR